MFQTEQGDTVAGAEQVNERVERGEVREVMKEEIMTADSLRPWGPLWGMWLSF